EVVGDTDEVRRLVVRDYVRPVSPGGVEEALADRALDALDRLLEVELLELTNLAQPLGFPPALDGLDTATGPRGYRVLEEIPRVPRQRTRKLVAAFGSLSALLDADPTDLTAVEGIDDDLARRIHDALARPR
ncbi:helix-hairpin-helix domain-containing protein, partial [Nocardia gipuzkoensis]